MSRYINADKFKEGLSIPSASIVEIGKAIMAQIDEQPSADVVEVVRCMDCIHYNEYENGEKIIGEEEVHDGWCMRWSGIENVNRHDYCSYGERAEA